MANPKCKWCDRPGTEEYTPEKTATFFWACDDHLDEAENYAVKLTEDAEDLEDD